MNTPTIPLDYTPAEKWRHMLQDAEKRVRYELREEEASKHPNAQRIFALKHKLHNVIKDLRHA